MSKPLISAYRLRMILHYDTGKFRAQLQIGGINHYLGIFDTAEEAHEEYFKQATLAFGIFARAE